MGEPRVPTNSVLPPLSYPVSAPNGQIYAFSVLFREAVQRARDLVANKRAGVAARGLLALLGQAPAPAGLVVLKNRKTYPTTRPIREIQQKVEFR